MKKIFLGSNPLTSIAGLALGALQIAVTISKAGPAHWWDYASAIGIYILGRLAGDTNASKY